MDESKQNILSTAKKILNREIGIVAGCTQICEQRIDLPDCDLDSPELLPFRAFVSELHSFPIGEERKYWNPEALAAEDSRLNEIVDAAEMEIFLACKELVERWDSA